MATRQTPESTVNFLRSCGCLSFVVISCLGGAAAFYVANDGFKPAEHTQTPTLTAAGTATATEAMVAPTSTITSTPDRALSNRPNVFQDVFDIPVDSFTDFNALNAEMSADNGTMLGEHPEWRTSLQHDILKGKFVPRDKVTFTHPEGMSLGLSQETVDILAGTATSLVQSPWVLNFEVPGSHEFSTHGKLILQERTVNNPQLLIGVAQLDLGVSDLGGMETQLRSIVKALILNQGIDGDEGKLAFELQQYVAQETSNDWMVVNRVDAQGREYKSVITKNACAINAELGERPLDDKPFLFSEVDERNLEEKEAVPSMDMQVEWNEANGEMPGFAYTVVDMDGLNADVATLKEAGNTVDAEVMLDLIKKHMRVLRGAAQNRGNLVPEGYTYVQLPDGSMILMDYQNLIPCGEEEVVVMTPTGPVVLTATNTNTPGQPPTATPTRPWTVTPGVTETWQPSVTPTITNTPPRSATPTPTPSRTNTPQHTNTPTSTPSRTNTPSRTPTITNTPVGTPTDAQTQPPQETATPGGNLTVTPGNTPENTPVPNPTESPVPLDTPTFAPSSTPMG